MVGIQLKSATQNMVVKSVNGHAPQYLSNLFVANQTYSSYNVIPKSGANLQMFLQLFQHIVLFLRAVIHIRENLPSCKSYNLHFAVTFCKIMLMLKIEKARFG